MVVKQAPVISLRGWWLASDRQTEPCTPLASCTAAGCRGQCVCFGLLLLGPLANEEQESACKTRPQFAHWAEQVIVMFDHETSVLFDATLLSPVR